MLINFRHQQKPSKIGRIWETESIRIFEKNGCMVEDVATKKLPYDLIVDGKKIQCKALSFKPNSTLLRIGKGGTGSCLGYQVNDFNYLMVQVIDISEWFCVPINCIPRHPKNNNQITYQFSYKKILPFKKCIFTNDFTQKICQQMMFSLCD